MVSDGEPGEGWCPFDFRRNVMAGLDPAIPVNKARPCHIIGIAGSSPAMTADEPTSS
jgi:hypothetical protein